MCEDPVTNTNPVSKLTIRVYFVEDREGRLTDLGVSDYIPVGYLIHLDATAKDAENRETNGRGDAVRFFFFGDLSSVAVSGNHPFQRKVRVLRPGSIEVEAELERVRSNRLKLKLG